MSHKQKKAFILIGASGSGKSTVRKQLEAKHAAQSFSLDDCRIKFYENQEFREVQEGESVSDVYVKAFNYCSAHHKDFDNYIQSVWQNTLADADVIIVDNVNGTRKSRAKWVEGLRKEKFHITMVQIQTPLNVILERQQTRGDKSVGADIVRAQYMRQEEAMVGSECDALLVIDGTKPWSA